MPAPARPQTLSNHPGSTKQELADEPAWGRGHEHRTGFRNKNNIVPGITSDPDHHHLEDEEDEEFVKDASRKYQDLRDRAKNGQLLNFQDIMKDQTVRAGRKG